MKLKSAVDMMWELPKPRRAYICHDASLSGIDMWKMKWNDLWSWWYIISLRIHDQYSLCLIDISILMPHLENIPRLASQYVCVEIPFSPGSTTRISLHDPQFWNHVEYCMTKSEWMIKDYYVKHRVFCLCDVRTSTPTGSQINAKWSQCAMLLTFIQFMNHPISQIHLKFRDFSMASLHEWPLLKPRRIFNTESGDRVVEPYWVDGARGKGNFDLRRPSVLALSKVKGVGLWWLSHLSSKAPMI